MEEFPITNEGFHVCSMCECHPSAHVYFWPCPLLEKEKVCCECCLEDVGKEEAIANLEKITGVKRTREQIDAICHGCGLRP